MIRIIFDLNYFLLVILILFLGFSVQVMQVPGFLPSVGPVEHCLREVRRLQLFSPWKIRLERLERCNVLSPICICVMFVDKNLKNYKKN
jgi:hypothetical protein